MLDTNYFLTWSAAASRLHVAGCEPVGDCMDGEMLRLTPLALNVEL